MVHATPLPLSVQRRRTAALLLIALLLVGCGRGDSAEETTADRAGASISALADDFDGAWQGVLPCVDCAGLEVELSLRRSTGEPARYTLVERYLGGAFEGEFTSEGEWREADCVLDDEAGACIVLVDAAQRWFRHEDGSLQALDGGGLPIDPEGARLTRL